LSAASTRSRLPCGGKPLRLRDYMYRGTIDVGLDQDLAPRPRPMIHGTGSNLRPVAASPYGESPDESVNSGQGHQPSIR
jgi:hypothetical protein